MAQNVVTSEFFCLFFWNVVVLLLIHCLLYIRKFLPGFYFRETSQMRSFVKIKPSQNGGINLSFTDVGKSCQNREFLTWQICFLTLFAKNKILAKISEFTV